MTQTRNNFEAYRRHLSILDNEMFAFRSPCFLKLYFIAFLRHQRLLLLLSNQILVPILPRF